MSASLLVKPDLRPGASQVHRITPESAGWRYVGFEVFDLAAGRTLERSLPGREQCLVLLAGRAAVRVGAQDLGTIGLFALVGYVIVRRQALGFRSAKTLDDLWFRFKLPWIPWDEWPEDERRFAKVGWSLMFAFVLLSLVRMFRKH